MQLREVFNQQQEWDQRAVSVAHATFLQSWAWGEGQAALGKKVRRFFVEEKGEMVFIAQAIEERRRGVAYWFIPGGPIGLTPELGKREWEEVVLLLKHELLRGTAVFLRVEPLLEVLDKEYVSVPSPWIKKPSFNPAIRWMIDLRGATEAKVLSAMEQKTRYNTRLGEKYKVATRLSTSEQDFAVFLTLTHEMAKRNKITVHSDSYLRATFFAMVKAGIAKLRVAEYQGEILAASIEVAFGDTVTYLHGASTSKMRDIKAPNVLQWQAIREALQQGYAWYDFGGCNPVEVNDPLYKKSLEGVTRFKEGWGGERVRMAGTFVVPRWEFLRRLF